MFSVIQPQFERVLMPFHNNGRNMDLPEPTGDRVSRNSERIGTKESQVGFVSQHSHVDSFSGLLSKGMNHQW